MALVSHRFPYILLRIKIFAEPRDLILAVEALLDTGFDGDLVLPAQQLASVPAPDTHVTWRLADGSFVEAPVHAGEVQLPGLEGSFSALVSVLGDEAIVGRGLSDRFRVILDHGRQVIVEP